MASHEITSLQYFFDLSMNYFPKPIFNAFVGIKITYFYFLVAIKFTETSSQRLLPVCSDYYLLLIMVELYYPTKFNAEEIYLP